MAIPRARRRAVHPYLDDVEPIAMAHRGGGDPGRENTMAAFEDAVRVGYQYLETDVQVTRDGALLAFHDATLDRVTDRSGPIARLSWDEVRQARIGGVHPIARVEELFSSFPQACINLDIKSDGAVAPLVAYLERVPALLERACIGSFSDARIDAVRRAFGRRVCTSAGPTEVRRLRLSSLGGRLADRVPIAADCIQVPPRHGRIPLVDGPFLAAAHRRGLPVHVWTVNDAPTMDEMLDRGVQGVVTDRTRLLRAVLRRRGQWHGRRRLGLTDPEDR